MDIIMQILGKVIWYAMLPVRFLFGFIPAIVCGAVAAIPAFIKAFMLREQIKINLSKVSKSLADFEPVRTITAEEIINIIIRDTGAQYVSCRDNVYKIYKLEDVKWFVSKDNTSEYEYISSYFDCDDFQDVLKGRLKVAFPGIAISEDMVYTTTTGHDLNGIITEQLEHRYIEPQSDSVFSKKERPDWSHHCSRL